MTVIIDGNICKGIDACPSGGLCIEVCLLKAVNIVDKKPVVDNDICSDCGLCVLGCPRSAMDKI